MYVLLKTLNEFRLEKKGIFKEQLNVVISKLSHFLKTKKQPE